MRTFLTGKRRRFQIFFVTVNEPYASASELSSEYSNGNITEWLDKKNSEIRSQKGFEFAKTVIVHIEPVVNRGPDLIAEA